MFKQEAKRWFQQRERARGGEGKEEGEDYPSIHILRQRESCQENIGGIPSVCIYNFLVTCLNIHFFSSPSLGMMGAMSLSFITSL